MADVSGVDNLTSSSNGSTSLTGIKSAIDNLNSAKAETTAVVPNTRTVAGHALSADVTLVKGDVGLGNVDNTSDATKNSAAATLLNKIINAALNTISNISEAMLALTDVTTGNVSTSAHGFAPKAPNDVTKFLDGTGAFSIPNGTLPRIRIATSFETAARFNNSASAGSGAVTFSNVGLQLNTGATGSSCYAEQYLVGADTNVNLFAAGGIFSTTIDVNAVGTTGSAFAGIGAPTVAGTGHTFTVNHIGFKVVISGSVATLFATVADGTEVATSLGTVSANDVVDVIAQIISTSSVNFYWRKNGGALSAATNISTHIPTSNTNIIQLSIANDSTATTNKTYYSAVAFER